MIAFEGESVLKTPWKMVLSSCLLAQDFLRSFRAFDDEHLLKITVALRKLSACSFTIESYLDEVAGISNSSFSFSAFSAKILFLLDLVIVLDLI